MPSMQTLVRLEAFALSEETIDPRFSRVTPKKLFSTSWSRNRTRTWIAFTRAVLVSKQMWMPRPKFQRSGPLRLACCTELLAIRLNRRKSKIRRWPKLLLLKPKKMTATLTTASNSIIHLQHLPRLLSRPFWPRGRSAIRPSLATRRSRWLILLARQLTWQSAGRLPRIDQ